MTAETISSDKRPIRILVADDHPVVREGIARHFVSCTEHEVVGCVGSAQGVFSVLSKTDVDVVILDIQMPGVTGPETIRKLCDHGAKVLLFSLMRENSIVASLIEAGAKGFVSKSESLKTLCEATERIYQQGTIIPGHIAKLLQKGIVLSDKLPPREKDVYILLGSRVSPKEIVFELGLSVSTVYSNIERIRTRLGLISTDEVINHAAEWASLESDKDSSD